MSAALRVAILGCGTIARREHLPSFAALGRDIVDVVAFASRTRGSASAAAKQWGSGEVLDDWRAAVERDDVDAVAICAPNALHAEMAAVSAKANKHVLVEKPMAITLAEADAMIDAAEAAGVVLMAAHNVRFAPPYAAAAEAVTSGRVGEVVGIRVAIGHPGPESWSPASAWFRDPATAGGGVLIDLGVHAADLVRAVTGDEVAEVSAVLRRPSPDAVEESAVLAFSMRRGAIGSLAASWTARPGPDHQLVVHGTDGSLTIERGQAVVRPADGGDKVVVEPAVPGSNVASAFVAACRAGTPPPVTGDDGRAALAIVLAAYESAERRQAVAVDHRSR